MKDYYAGKPYADFPVHVRSNKVLRSADHKNRNPGLINIDRKINHNEYENHRPASQAETIRKYGMNFQKKLQKRYDCTNHKKVQTKQMPEINYERELNFWYG